MVSKNEGRGSNGFVLDPAERVGILDIINDEGDLASIAADVGCSAITLCKAVGGHPISAQTVLQVQRYLEEEGFFDDEESEEDSTESDQEEIGDSDFDDEVNDDHEDAA
jgi:hypothetical protein